MARNNFLNNQNIGNGELMVFLKERFDNIDNKFIEFQNQHISDYQELADLMIGQFEKVYGLLEKKPDRNEVKEMVKTEVAVVMNNITRLNDKIDDIRADQICLKRQVDKHEKWHFQTAAKVGIILK